MSRTLRIITAVPTLSVLGIVFVTACHSGDATGVTPPPTALTLSVGASAPAVSGQEVRISGGSDGGEYLLVVTDTVLGGSGTSAFHLTASGIAAPGSVSPPATLRAPTGDLLPAGTAATDARLDIGYGVRLNERFRGRFSSMMQAMHAAQPIGTSALRSVVASASVIPQPGNLVQYNVSPNACDSIVTHTARVMAVGSEAIIAEDTLDPPGGFTASDYQRFAADFDTLVYPLDVANFGAPGDIDQNGHVVLLFTRAVNELTPAHAGSFVGGFFFSRDLFPHTATPTLEACPGSNLAEMFYLLAPDPTGAVNGNVRTTGFVDSLTTSLVAHEFQHLINASRRIYVNKASDLEVVWLNEGLSHIAEELLFYRQAGLAPRQNITSGAIRANNTARLAFNTDQASNAARYRVYLSAPSVNSPVRNDDSLGTRGATWDFLRYAADRKLRGGGDDASVFQPLVNSTTTGVANLHNVFGADLDGWIRDWSVSHYTDDVTPAISADLMQPSWNWHDIYPALGSGGGSYPLAVTSLTTSGATGSVIPGSSAFYRFAVPAGSNAAVMLSGGVGVGTIVRVR